MARLLECPKCHNKLLVQRSDTLYQCVGCDFKRDLLKTKDTVRSSPGSTVLWAVMTVFLVSFLLWNREAAVNETNYPPDYQPEYQTGYDTPARPAAEPIVLD